MDVQDIGDRLIAVGSRGVIAFSDDEGVTWSQAYVPISSSLNALHFPSEDHGWVVGHAGVILHSSDRGETWKLQYDGQRAVEDQLVLAEKKLTLMREAFDKADSVGKEELEYDLEDAEFAVSDAKFEKSLGPANPFLDVWFRNNKHGYAVGAYGLFFATVDGGENWEIKSDRLENYDRYHLNSISGLGDTGVLIVGEAGTVFGSYNEGLDWEVLYTPYQGSFFGIQETERGVIAYGLKGSLYRSEDEGKAWEKVELNISTTLTSSDVDESGEITLVGFSGVVLKSSDEGRTFTKVEQNGYDSYTGVVGTKNSGLVLISDKGVSYGAK